MTSIETNSERRQDTDRPRRGRVAVCGTGNIGSHLVTDLANRARVASMVVIDRDLVEERNCVNQTFQLSDVGKPKAEVTAARLRCMAPDVEIEAIVSDLEDVPLGVFAEVDVCLGGLDSLRARQVLANEYAYPLGIPVVDGAVDGEGGWFGKVQVLVPGSACLECPWGQEHYRQLSREMPCEPRGATVSEPNRASALLGAAVARLMTDQVERVLSGGYLARSYEIAMDLHHERRFTSWLRPANGCRFDHVIARERIVLNRAFSTATLGDLRDAALNWADDEDLQFEFRRTVFGGFTPGARWQSPISLARFGDRPLSDIGLMPRDRIRLRTCTRQAFVVLNDSDAHVMEARP